MKTRFSTLDIVAVVSELNERCQSLRVSNVYNINNKTYLLRLNKATANDTKEEDEDLSKNALLLESGCRIHLTEYDWPKEATPNSFAMKLRKHIKNKRVEYIKQMGFDRIIDIQFGSKESAYHLIVELYDRGNICITDYNYVILNILRPRRDGENEDVKFLVKEKYPTGHFQGFRDDLTSKEKIEEFIAQGKPGDNLKKILNPKFTFGPALLEHCFIECGLGENCKLDANKSIDLDKVYNAVLLAKKLLMAVKNQREGYIIQKEEENIVNKDDEDRKKIISFLEFNPILFNQYAKLDQKNQTVVKYDSYNKAIDVFFSSIEGQKIDHRIYQKEKEAMRKLDNIKKDHERRLNDLEEQQKIDQRKAYLIEINTDLVEKALYILRSALAQQMSWNDIKQMLKEAKEADDLVANKICSLKFDVNAFTMLLDDPYEQQNDGKTNQMKVDISLELSAYGNARKYFEEKKQAKKKEDKTIEATGKALKNAQIKTNKAIKEVQLKSSIIKSRKVLWFEKFFWFISSENYIVIGGRDAQQNEMIVKRYLRPGDLYVHADLHGASSVVIKNSSKKKIPSKTIEEAGCFAVCYSSAWEAKTPVRAWWVEADQVSKTAPTGEYLTIGSFMIRGKKNYLPSTQLAMGFCFFFRLNEESIANHLNDRKVKYIESDEQEIVEEDDDNESAFPDTKIKLDNKTEKEENMVLEPMRPRQKQQIRKPKNSRQDKKSNEQNDKQQQQPQPQTTNKQNKQSKSKKGKGKKNKKDDDWSDDEDDKIKIKLEKKLEKDNRLMALEDQIKAVSIDDDLEDVELDDDEVNKEEPREVEAKVNIEPIKEEQDGIIRAEANGQNAGSSDEDDKNAVPEDEEDEEEEETNEERREAEYLKLVNSLTGQPLNEDILMYCIPVVAPYSAVVNCKFKVKVLPGTNKRGKAAKTALHLFSNDKKATNKERDLIKSMKDQEISRNLPNHIKITAQHLVQIKRKK